MTLESRQRRQKVRLGAGREAGRIPPGQGRGGLAKPGPRSPGDRPSRALAVRRLDDSFEYEVTKLKRMASSLALLTSVMVAACTGPGGASDGPVAPVQVALEPYVGRLVTVDVGIDGDTVRLIFDTGGGQTLVSPEVAGRIGCTPSGRSTSFRMTGERIDVQLCHDVTLSIGGLAFEHQELGVWDIHAVLPEGVPPVDGVLSLKTFAAQPFSLDLGAGLLTLETATSYRDRTRDMVRLESRLATGLDGDELDVLVRGEVDAPAWFLLDSANLDVVQAAAHLGGSGDVWEHVPRLDGMPPVTKSFRTRDILYDGVLSEEFMREWSFTFDLASNEVWVTKAG